MAEELLRTTNFVLTRADALAYEQASARSSPLGVLALLLWLGAWGSAAFLIPPDWAGHRLGWSFPVLVSILLAIAYVLVLISASFRQWLAAGRRIGRPVGMIVAEWPDRLEVDGPGAPRQLAFPDIRESILTPTHLFLVSDGGVLILPKHVFAEDGVIEHLAARIAGRPPPVATPAGAPARTGPGG